MNKIINPLEVAKFYNIELDSHTLNIHRSSASLNCYKIFFDVNDKPYGYVIWAEVTKETLFQFFKYGTYPVHLYEYNEGRIILIFYVFYKHGKKFQVMRNVKNFIFNKSKIVAFKTKDNKKIYFNKGDRFFMV